MKFTQADTVRTWESTVPVTKPLNCSHDLAFAGGARLDFGGDADAMSERVFDHVSELAAEAWLKAALRWRAVQKQSAPSPGAGKPPETLSAVLLQSSIGSGPKASDSTGV